MTNDKNHLLKLHGSVTLGAKGQIVIPKEIREMMGINTGDTLMIFTKGSKGIGMVKAEDLNGVIEYMTKEMENSDDNCL